MNVDDLEGSVVRDTRRDERAEVVDAWTLDTPGHGLVKLRYPDGEIAPIHPIQFGLEVTQGRLKFVTRPTASDD